MAFDLPAEHLRLPGQLAVLEHAADLGEHVVEHDGLEDVVRRPGAQRLDGALDAPVGRHHEGHGLWRDLAQFAEHGEPVGAGHPKIGDDDREVVRVQGSQGRRAVDRRLDGVAGVAQHLCEALAHTGLVVGDQDRLRHGPLSSRSIPGRTSRGDLLPASTADACGWAPAG